MFWIRISANPYKNLRETAQFINVWGSSKLAIYPNAEVVIVKIKKPNRMLFLAPNLFFIIALKGAKIIYATAKMEIISATSLEPI